MAYCKMIFKKLLFQFYFEILESLKLCLDFTISLFLLWFFIYFVLTYNDWKHIVEKVTTFFPSNVL